MDAKTQVNLWKKTMFEVDCMSFLFHKTFEIAQSCETLLSTFVIV